MDQNTGLLQDLAPALYIGIGVKACSLLVRAQGFGFGVTLVAFFLNAIGYRHSRGGGNPGRPGILDSRLR